MALSFQHLCPLLQVFDMPRSIAFYRDVLGFEVTESAPPGDDCDWALLRRGDVYLMLNTMYERDDRPAAPDPARRAVHADTALFFACPDVDAAYDHLVARGQAPTPPAVQSYGMKQVYLLDPDGYSLCFQWKAA